MPSIRDAAPITATSPLDATGGDGSDSTIFQSISIRVDEAVGSATISPSGRDVCLASRRGLHIVDLQDPWATPRFLPYYSAIVADVQWSPHPSRAHWIVSTSGNKGLVWNLASSMATTPIEHVCLGHERSITDMNWAVFQVDTLATCGMDGNVLAFDMRTGGRKAVSKYCGWRYGATQVKYNRQNPNELASSHGEFVYIWDDRKGSRPVTVIRAHEQKIYGIDYSRKRKDKIVTCSLDSTVKYWTLDGSAEISEPTEVLQTASPVWRARHTPFGEGLVTLPQRSEHAVKLWATGAVQREIYKVTAHTDVVREFLWRSRGGDNPDDDDRVFQLVTWGNDNQLLLTPIPPATCAEAGHVPHSPMQVRHLRRNAENRSYRDTSISPASQGISSGFMPGASVSPTTALHSSSGSFHSDGASAKMTPPTLLTNISTARQPLSAASASRYGRSANSATSASSAGASPLFGTSPSDLKIAYNVSRSYKAPSAMQLVHSAGADSSRSHGRGGVAESQPLQQNFMTRATAGGRRAAGHDAVEWMENVRIVQKPHDTAVQSERPAGQEQDVDEKDDDDSVLGDNVTFPLHEEVTAMARVFESRVSFEKIAIPQRTVVASLYGPWGSSGVAARLKATFAFPAAYPGVPVSIDIERSSHIDNKARAGVLSAVRALAQKYASVQHNSFEACLVCLLEGKMTEPVDDALLGTEQTPDALLLMSGLPGSTGDVDDVDDEQGMQRYLANRNCPPPRRCGAVFSPSGCLFAFFPLDNTPHAAAEKRQRSVSPAGDRKSRRRRRRLFESFGVIPSLQMRYRAQDPEAGGEDQPEEDSDPVLNIPSLLLGRRRGPSRYVTESHDGTSQYTRRPGFGRAFNTRIYIRDLSSVTGVDVRLSSAYTVRGSFEDIVMTNAEAAVKYKASQLVATTWITLCSLVQGGKGAAEEAPSVVLGERLAEKMVLNLLDIFCRLGDTQTLGMLACLLEVDRRNTEMSKVSSPVRPARSPAHAVPIDYFNVKPVRISTSSPRAAGHDADSEPRYTPSLLPLKSPKDWLISSSYGTQNSSSGSRGSSWANNLSTLFKAGAASVARGTHTPPHAIGGGSAGATGSPASLSPAFVKRPGPLSAISEGHRKAGGISSNRPRTTSAKTRTTTHVSFASDSDGAATRSPAYQGRGPSKPLRIIVSDLKRPIDLRERSLILSNENLMRQLEYYKLLYAELLFRLERSQERAQVLKLTRPELVGHKSGLLQQACGMDEKDSAVGFKMACRRCASMSAGKGERYCDKCRRAPPAQLCAYCHMPLTGLIDTCLTCLHSSHLACLQEWQASETGCPAACSCLCTVRMAEEPLSTTLSSPLSPVYRP